jgi:hypothetical protein
MLRTGLKRAFLASFVCSGFTALALFLLYAGMPLITERKVPNPGIILTVPLSALGFVPWYMLGLLLFGLPTLWLIPGAFQRGRWRCLAAMSIGAMVPLATGFPGRNLLPLWIAIPCAMFAAFVWWFVNADAADNRKPE